MFTHISKSFHYNNGGAPPPSKSIEFDKSSDSDDIEIKNGHAINKKITKKEFDKYLEKKGFVIDDRMFLDASIKLINTQPTLEDGRKNKKIKLEKRFSTEMEKPKKINRKYIEKQLNNLELEALQYNLKQLGVTYKSKNKKKVVKRIIMELDIFI
jgi:hypothetical protein